MKTIEVKNVSMWEVNVPVVVRNVDDEIIYCNHANTFVRYEDFASGFHEISQPVETCRTCYEWRIAEDFGTDGGWQK